MKTPIQPLSVSTRRRGVSIRSAMGALKFITVIALACSFGRLPLSAASPAPGRGIAILASDIGTYYPVASLREFVLQGGFSSVIIDWAWVTYHYERTDFAAVRELVRGLQTNNVVVAAMYRPRFLEAPTVPEQVDATGQPAASYGHYPCFSSAAARQWSWSWGTGILTNCPQFNEIIIYNPIDICQCPSCQVAKINDAYGPVWTFLSEAKNAWRAFQPAARLGVVYNPERDFWLRGSNIIDVARPFFVVRDDADLAANMAEVLTVRGLLGTKAGPVLAKVTWDSETVISLATLSNFVSTTRAQSVPWDLWIFDTLFLSPAYDPAAVAAVLGSDYQAIEPALRELGGTHAEPDVPNLAFPPTETAFPKLPWPHQPPGLTAAEIAQLNRDVWVINNEPLYQADQAGDWCYFHGGLDIVLTNGTPIYAMKDGWVKAIAYSAVIVADVADDQPGFGWSYGHLGNVRVQPGQFVPRGTLLGEVSFEGLSHIHLEKVYSQDPYWSSWRYLCFPDDHFTFLDAEPPTIRTPFYFFENNRDSRFVPQSDGRMAIRGDVDIVVAMRDGGEFAHAKDAGAFGDRLAVTRIEYSIRPAPGSGGPTRRFRSFDFRTLRLKSALDLAGQDYNTRLVKTAFKHFGLFGGATSGDKSFSYYIISNCPGDAPPAEIAFAFTNHCWQTGAHDDAGAPLYPDGDYLLEVTAFDSLGNSATNSMHVIVDNAGKYPITTRPPGGAEVVVWGLSGSGQAAVPDELWNVAAVAGGAYHSAALTAPGAVVTWGGEDFGQRNVPAGLRPVLALAVATYHTLALTDDGRVTAWGDPAGGRTAVPATLSRVVAVAAGELHSLALRDDGTVVAWGSNLDANNVYTGQATVPPGLANVTAIAAGAYHSLALRADGRVVAWGDNRLGQGSVPAGLTNVVAIAAGHSHNLAVRADGRVTAWGDNYWGQLNVPADLTNAVRVSAGMIHNLALTRRGTVVVWGDNRFGQAVVPANLSNVVGIAAGVMHSLALVRSDPLDPLRLWAPRLAGNTFSVSLATMEGKRYCLEYKDSLSTGSWTSLPALRGYGYGVTRTLSGPAAQTGQRFYRVRRLD